jgi:hypothetical protein
MQEAVPMSQQDYYTPGVQRQVTPPPPPPQKKGGGCCLFSTGCLVALIIMLLLFVGGTLYAFFKVRDFATDTQPAALPEVVVTDAARENAKEKMAELKSAIESNRALAASEGQGELQGKLALGIRDEHVTADFSVPLNEVPGFKGRYLNGSLVLKATVENGILEVYLVEASFNGKPVPAPFLSELRTTNLAQQVYEDPNAREMLKHIRRLTVAGGQVSVTTTGE